MAHSNCFIPSTLGGPVNSENGIDTEQLKHNLDLATDVYTPELMVLHVVTQRSSCVKKTVVTVQKNY